MSLNLERIAAALNAYPWVAGTLTSRGSTGVPRYCAIGLLLRYAGVPQEQMACGHGSPAGLRQHLPLLEAEYGIADWDTAGAIIEANDSATSHEEAIERVQRVLTCEPAERMRAMSDIIERGDRPQSAADRGAQAHARAGPEHEDGSGLLAVVG